ncbi:MAG: ABC transporter permease [Halanaerobiales bacterium]|nr:ABC transporter permease [Halanaerobiales bacterium]
MINYIVRRLLILPLILFGVTLLVFGMLMMLGPYQRLATYVQDPSQLKGGGLDKLITKYGLDDPFYMQYGRWAKGILQGDLGWSEAAGAPVARAIMDRFPATLELAILGVIPVIFGGIWLGVFSAVHHNDFWDHATRVFSTVGWSFPTFVFGLIILMIFYGVLGWTPPGRLSNWALELKNTEEFIRYTDMNIVDGLLNGNFAFVFDSLRHLVAPVFTLAVVWWAFILRITRSSMLETLRKDYIRTARAKGVKENVVINKHARRNALIPVVTVAGPMVLGLLGGIVTVETVFGYRGLGLLAYQAATRLDYAGILGIAMYFGGILVLINLIVDVSYAFIDPRIRLE